MTAKIILLLSNEEQITHCCRVRSIFEQTFANHLLLW